MDRSEVILRDFLAEDRTRMSNVRTLLSVVRTGLYFIVAGFTLLKVKSFQQYENLTPYLLISGFSIILYGIISLIITKKKITKAYTKFKI
jgi:putative membrane protein